jgi:hypothetical protein
MEHAGLPGEDRVGDLNCVADERELELLGCNKRGDDREANGLMDEPVQSVARMAHAASPRAAKASGGTAAGTAAIV